MVQAVEASLKRLKTDYIDLYWMHIWDQLTPAEETMRALDDLVRQGKVLYVGVSDAPAWWVAQANTLAHFAAGRRSLRCKSNTACWSAPSSANSFPLAKALNIGVTAWSPLAGGILSGKYHGQAALVGRQGRAHERPMMKDFLPDQQRAERVVEALKQLPIKSAAAWRRSRWRGCVIAPSR